jgi:hypothetical protein
MENHVLKALAVWLILLVPFNASASQSLSCEVDQFQALKEFIENVQSVSEFPHMKMSYSLSADCVYTLTSEVEISDDNSLKDFMINKIINPKMTIESNRDRVLDNTVTEQKSGGYKQVTTVKKDGLSVDIESSCKFLKKFSDEISYECRVNPSKSKFKGIFKLFDSNLTLISCKPGLEGIKKCIFKTIGKANSIPLIGNSCDLASAGAAETFESIYRLSHYITHGNVANINRGKEAIDRFYSKAQKHPDNGKKSIKITEIVQ